MMTVLLALGIGLNSALFTVIYSLVRMPPPGIALEESLVRIRGVDRNRGPGGTLGREFSYREYRDYAARTNLFSAVAAWTSADVVLGAGSLHSGAATFVTANYFQVLGVRPTQGAGLPVSSPDEGAAQLVGVISDVVWDRVFGRAPDVVGRTIDVNGVTVSIVGVAPKRFAGARVGGSQMRVWLPLNARVQVLRAGAAALSSPDTIVFSLAARLQPGVLPEQTAATVQAIAARAEQQSERWRASGAISTEVVALQADNYYPPSGEPASVGGRLSSLLIPLLILLIPCTNVSGLLVGLALKRRREIAVRLSLGAGRRRIVRQLITESVLLALAAALVGLAVIVILMRTIGLRLPTVQLALHWPALVFTFTVAVFTGILFGISPALHATRVSVADVLKNSANAVASTRSRLQSGLVVTQIALTQPLLLGLGALLLSLFSDLQRLPDRPLGDRIPGEFQHQHAPAATEQQRTATLLRLEERFAACRREAVVPRPIDRTGRVTVHPADRVPGHDNEGTLTLNIHASAARLLRVDGFPVFAWPRIRSHG
jgi:predicted permease